MSGTCRDGGVTLCVHIDDGSRKGKVGTSETVGRSTKDETSVWVSPTGCKETGHGR